MKRILFLVFFVPHFIFAQSPGIITGKIIDKEGNLSLPGATVALDGNKRYTISNNIGEFEFLSVPAGKYSVTVSYIGFQPLTQEVTVVAGQNSTINFVMNANVGSLDEVVIMGDILRGQARAINQQKNNQNITNVISSDQVGRFPDANIGDALKRVPGITMQNDQGEARNIIVRGLAPSLNSVTLNGDRIPSAEGDNRNVQMDLIPSDMVSTIEVNKTLTSDMDADAIGGSVNLITRASPNGQRISATVAGGYGPIRNKANFTAGLVYGNRFLKDKLGMVLSGSFFENNFGSDNVEAVWVNGKKNQAFVEELDIRKYDVQRVRRSTALALDYKINDRNTLYANAMYNWRDDRENRFRARYRGIKPTYDDTDNIIGYKGDIRRQTKGGIDDNRNKNTRLEEQKVQNYSLRGEHLLSPKLDFDWQVNYAKAQEYRPSERYIEHQSRGLKFTEDLSNPEKPVITTPNDVPGNYSFRVLSENHNLTNESEVGAKFNFRTPLSVIDGQKGRLRFGGRIRIKDKKRDNIFYQFKPATAIGTIDALPNEHFDGKNWQVGSQYVPGTFVTPSYIGGLNLNNSSLFERKAIPSEYLSQNYRAKENIVAGYVRWDQDITEKLAAIIGLRVENTNIDYKGNYVLDEEDLVGEVNNTNSYTNVLPNLTFKYDLNKSTVLRAAFTTSLARPNYYALAPHVSVLTEDTEIAAGNPHLKSTYAYNFDFMAEKYFRSVGLLTGGVFYKNLKNFIYTYRNERFTTSDFAGEFPGIANPIPTGENWLLVQDRNGDNVDVYGFEVAFQRKMDFLPGKFFKGLSVYLNYTRTESSAKGITNADGEVRENVKLPGASPNMFNASLAWENRKFSARASLNYSSSYIDELGGSEFEDRYYDKQMFVDVNASYKITPKLRVFAEGNNLTNQPLRYYQGIKSRTAQVEYYQGRYNLGLKFDL